MSKKRSVRSNADLKIAKPPEGDSPPPASRLTVVGVGASAGGLEAFTQLLRALPDCPGLVLIFVQHMAPHHDSALPSLLAASTQLPVRQPTENVKLEPEHIYVVPPNRTLSLTDGQLVVRLRPTDRSQFTPIDAFFQSLAEEYREQAIGVILAGTGSDGVEGIQAIKAAGGLVLVQQPETAKQDGMPRAAIATGKCDHVLPPAEIAAELSRLAHARPPVRHTRPESDGPDFSLEDLQRVFAILRASSGVDFGQYKLPTLRRRIQRRMHLHKIDELPRYVGYLEQNAPEVQLLYQDILIHVTRFFREPESFQALAQEIFPEILGAQQGEAPIRIWVPACSTGEEPYSVVMTLLEWLDQHADESVPIQVFATDISEAAIEQARSGIFSPSAVEDLSPERLRRFFTKLDGQYRINKPIRDACIFARQDLTRDPPFSKLDLIVCRNVLIYLGQAVQSRLIGVFHYALKPTGYLMLGSAETIGFHSELFSITNKKHRIYKKQVGEAPADVHFQVPYPGPLTNRPPAEERAKRGAGGGSSVQSEASRLILNHYSPPGVIVDDDMRIVHFRGQTGKFLEPAPGDASLNLLKMCREGLLHGLRTALQTAKKKDAPVRREGLRVKTNGDAVSVTVEVVPLTPSIEGRHYLILFRDVVPAPPPPLRIAKQKKAGGSDHAEELERLQKELVASREYLQSIIQDQEAANEELQSANEEILSSNEELQSTNEELDTAKEELQSTNEELNTLNEELHARNEELARVNSDLVNVLNGVQIAIVIVDRELRIRRFTPVAERVLNLIPGDIGRPISQIKPDFDCPDLERLILQVIDTMALDQREVHDSQGRTFSLTIRPYKNIENRIDGAVLVLLDIDDVRRHQAAAQQAREYAEAVLATIRHPLLVLDGDLRVRTANQMFLRAFRLSRSQVEGQLLYEINGGEWNIPELRRLLEDVLPNCSQFDDFEVEHDFQDVGRKKVRLNARRIAASNSRPALILLALEVAS